MKKQLIILFCALLTISFSSIYTFPGDSDDESQISSADGSYFDGISSNQNYSPLIEWSPSYVQSPLQSSLSAENIVSLYDDFSNKQKSISDGNLAAKLKEHEYLDNTVLQRFDRLNIARCFFFTSKNLEQFDARIGVLKRTCNSSGDLISFMALLINK